MRTMIMAEVAATEPVKGLELFESQHLKTKTKLSCQWDEKTRSDFYGKAESDVGILGIEGSPVSNFVVTVEGVKALGRILNRSIVAFGKIGIKVEELDWEADTGVFTFEDTLPFVGSDIPTLVECTARLVARSMSTVGYTHHPFTLYDMKQAMGLVHDAKTGNVQALHISEWMETRELVLLEEAKAAKAAAKPTPKAKAASKAKATAKAAVTAKNAKPVAKGKTKAAKTANLAHLM